MQQWNMLLLQWGLFWYDRRTCLFHTCVCMCVHVCAWVCMCVHVCTWVCISIKDCTQLIQKLQRLTTSQINVFPYRYAGTANCWGSPTVLMAYHYHWCCGEANTLGCCTYTSMYRSIKIYVVHVLNVTGCKFMQQILQFQYNDLLSHNSMMIQTCVVSSLVFCLFLENEGKITPGHTAL